MNGGGPAASGTSEWEAALCLLTASLQAIVVFVRSPSGDEEGGGEPDSALRVPFTSGVAFERNGKFAWLQRRTGDAPVQALACGVTSDMRQRYMAAVECRAAAFRLARAAGQDVPAVAEFSVPPRLTGRLGGLDGVVASAGMMLAGGPSPSAASPGGQEAAAAAGVATPVAMATPPPAVRQARASTATRRSAASERASPASRVGPQSPWSAASALPVADLGRASAWAVGDVVSPDAAAVAARLERAGEGARSGAPGSPGRGEAAGEAGRASWPRAEQAGAQRRRARRPASRVPGHGVRGAVEDACLRLSLAKAAEDADRWGWEERTGQLLAACARAVALAEPLPCPQGDMAVVGSHRFAAAAAAPWLPAPPLAAADATAPGRASWWVVRAPPRGGGPCHLRSALEGAAARLHGSFERGPPGSLPPAPAAAAATARQLIEEPAEPALALLGGDLVVRRRPAAPGSHGSPVEGEGGGEARAGGLLLSRLADVSPAAWGGDLRGALVALRGLGCGQQRPAPACGSPAPSFEARVRAAVQRAKAMRDPEWHPESVAEAAAERGRRLRWLAVRQQQAARAQLECELLSRGLLPGSHGGAGRIEAWARAPSQSLA